MDWRPRRRPMRSAPVSPLTRFASLSVPLVAGMALIASLSGCGGSTGSSLPTSSAGETILATASTTGPPAMTATTPSTSTGESHAEIGEVVWAIDVDPDTKAPIAPVDHFSIEARTIYAVTAVRGLPPNAVLTAEWSYNDTSLDALTTSVVASAGTADGWVEFHLARAAEEPWPDGTYAIAISYDGAVVQVAEVTLSNE
jgi:hypothetical protein